MLQKQNFFSNFIYYSGIALVFLVIFTVVYEPLVQIGFYFDEDYCYFGLPRGLQFDAIYNEGVANGRVLESLLSYAQFIYLDSSEDSKVIRFISIIGVALLATVIYDVLKRCRFRSDQAFLISLLICILPSMQIIAAYMLVAPHILSAFLSSLAALVMFKVLFKEEDKERVTSYTKAGVITAIVLMIAALNINQPPTMMYWVMSIIVLLSRKSSDFSKKTFRQSVFIYFITGFISSTIYYVVFLKILPSTVYYTHHRSALISIQQIPHQIKVFLTGAIRLSMNLWNLNPSYYVLSFTGTIILFGIIFNTLKEMKEEKHFSAINSLQKYLLISILVMLSYLPKLMVTDPGYKLYLLFSLASSFSVLFCFGIINIVEYFRFIPAFSETLRKRTATVLLAVLTIVAALSAHTNMKGFSTYHASELNHLKSSIQEYGIAKLSNNPKIYIRRPRWTIPVPFEKINMYFNKGLTTYSAGGFILSVAGQALYEVGSKQGFLITHSTHPDGGIQLSIVGQDLHKGEVKKVKEIQITHGAANEPIPEDKNLLIVDMTKVDEAPRQYGLYDIVALSFLKITAQP